MGIAVRVAELSDAPALARLRWEFRPEDQHAQDLDGFSRDFEEWFGPRTGS